MHSDALLSPTPQHAKKLEIWYLIRWQFLTIVLRCKVAWGRIFKYCLFTEGKLAQSSVQPVQKEHTSNQPKTFTPISADEK